MTSLCPILRYVRHEDVADRTQQGWVKLADLGWPHGRWSVLMGWWLPGDPDDANSHGWASYEDGEAS